MDGAIGAAPAIADDAACSAAIARLGTIDVALARIEADKTAAVARAAATADEKAAPLAGERAELAARIESFCTANRNRLTAGGATKTVTFPAGACAWRKGRETIAIDAALEKAIIGKLQRLGTRFKRFLKPKVTISKTALLAATEAERASLKRIKGLAFLPGKESFSIEPVAIPPVAGHGEA